MIFTVHINVILLLTVTSSRDVFTARRFLMKVRLKVNQQQKASVLLKWIKADIKVKKAAKTQFWKKF